MKSCRRIGVLLAPLLDASHVFATMAALSMLVATADVSWASVSACTTQGNGNGCANVDKAFNSFGISGLANPVVTTFDSPITVSNFSFEILPGGGLPNSCGTGCSYSADNIPGWVSSSPASSGQFQPGSAGIFNSVPDGLTVAYSNSGTISQTVAPTVQLGVTYTLLVDVGVRNDLSNPGSVELVIGSNAPIIATGVLPPPGNWSTFTAIYTGVALDVGKSITIVLTSGAGQGDWDNVQLSDSAPEPASLSLVGLGLCAIVVARLRRS